MNDQFDSEFKYAAGDDMDRLSHFSPRKQRPFSTFLLFVLICGIAFIIRSDNLHELFSSFSATTAGLELCDVSDTGIDIMGNIHISGSVKSINFIARDVSVTLQLKNYGEVVFEDCTIIPLILIGQSEEFSFHLNFYEDLANISNYSGLMYSIFVEGKPFGR